MLPTLARFGGKEFLVDLLGQTMTYLLSIDYTREEIRDAAFRAVGDIVRGMLPTFLQFLFEEEKLNAL